MARQISPYQKKPADNIPILRLFLLLPLFFVVIGDITLFLFRSVLSVPVTAYNVVSRTFVELVRAFVHWSQEKTSVFHLPKKPGRPRKKPSVTLFPSLSWRISRNLTDLKKDFLRLVMVLITVFFWFFRVCIIVLSRIRMPVIFLKKSPSPKISVQRTARPALWFPKLPAFPFPKAYTVFPPPDIVIHRRAIQIKAFVVGVAATLILVFLPFWTYSWLHALPNPQLLSRRDLAVTTKIFDRNGALLYEIYTDQNRTPIPLSDIPPFVKEATVAIEDRDFYRHNGISLRGIVRAAWEILAHKRIQGGSTITQQLIKSALLSPEITVSRKIKEIFLAFWAERIYSKDQILEMYLNQVPYGGTAWGIEAASQTYFDKSVKDLSLAEASLLAGLPAAPTEYSPFGSQPQKAFERQAEVLRRMNEDSYITKEDAQNAYGTGLRFRNPTVAIRAPHFVMYIRELLEKRYSMRLIEQGGLRIVTSLDATMQDRLQDVVRSHIETLAPLRVGNGAALVTNPKTGEILAMVGSKNYFDLANEGNVNVTTALRQPGSSIKIVNYTAALERGFTAATVLDDSPIVYRVPGSAPYAPVNYDGKFHGPTPLRYALGNSYNIPAVKTLAKIGVGAMIEKGRLMGIESWTDETRYGLSLTLGGGEVTMLDMAKAYGTLANQGKRMDLLPILEITDYTGKVLERNSSSKGIQATSPEVAWIMSNVLSDNVARVSAFGPSSGLVIPNRTVSVKTGTSNDKRDNWTIGYTPSLVVVVWVGNNDNSPMDPLLTSGITGATPIWHDIMADLTRERSDEVNPKPVSIVELPCHMGRNEFFVRGTEPVSGRCAPLPSPSPTPAPN